MTLSLALVAYKRSTSSQDPKTTPFDVITNLQNVSPEQSGLGKLNVIKLPELCS